MEPRTVLITGCSSGIGLALVVKLAQDEQQRFKVIATMRNLEKREALEKAAGDTLNRTLEIKELDVWSERSIRDCVESNPKRRIDVLINIAGVGLIGPIECQSMEDMQGVFETNVYGVVRMIKEVLPDMKRRRSGHIVVMSSVMGLQAMSACPMGVFKGDMPHLTLIEPGPVVTEFELKVYEDAMRGDYSKADPETSDLFNYYLKNSKAIFSSLGQTPDEIAENTLRVLTMEMPPFRHQTNHVYTPLTALKYADPSGELVNDIFYKLVFQHSTEAGLHQRVIKLLRWTAQKDQQGARILGFLRNINTRKKMENYECYVHKPVNTQSCFCQVLNY